MSEQELTEIEEAQTNLQPGYRLLLMELRAIRKVCEMILDSLPPQEYPEGNTPEGKRAHWFKGNKSK